MKIPQSPAPVPAGEQISFPIVLCIASILAAGCIGAGTILPSPGGRECPVAPPFVTPAGSRLRRNYPSTPLSVSGGAPVPGHQFQIVFDLYMAKRRRPIPQHPNVCYNGTWIPAGDNTYLVTRDTVKIPSGSTRCVCHYLSINRWLPVSCIPFTKGPGQQRETQPEPQDPLHPFRYWT